MLRVNSYQQVGLGWRSWVLLDRSMPSGTNLGQNDEMDHGACALEASEVYLLPLLLARVSDGSVDTSGEGEGQSRAWLLVPSLLHATVRTNVVRSSREPLSRSPEAQLLPWAYAAKAGAARGKAPLKGT